MLRNRSQVRKQIHISLQNLQQGLLSVIRKEDLEENWLRYKGTALYNILVMIKNGTSTGV